MVVESGRGNRQRSLRSPVVEIPVVDLSGPTERVAIELDRACSEVGFVQVVGHRLDLDVENEAWECARRFFALPEADKHEVSISPGDAYGYGPYRVERLASSLGVDTPPDLKETFSIGPFKTPPLVEMFWGIWWGAPQASNACTASITRSTSPSVNPRCSGSRMIVSATSSATGH